MLDKRNLAAHELIGLYAKVIESTDKSRIGIEGIIIDETKNTIKIRTVRGDKILPKKEVKIEVKLPNGEKVELDLKKLVYRPEDRTKVFWREIV